MSDLPNAGGLAIASLICPLVFIVDRASSFHYLDVFIITRILGVRVN